MNKYFLLILIIFFNGCANQKKCISVVDENNSDLIGIIYVYELNLEESSNELSHVIPEILTSKRGRLIAKSTNGKMCFKSINKSISLFNSYKINILTINGSMTKYYNDFDSIPLKIISKIKKSQKLHKPNIKAKVNNTEVESANFNTAEIQLY